MEEEVEVKNSDGETGGEDGRSGKSGEDRGEEVSAVASCAQSPEQGETGVRRMRECHRMQSFCNDCCLCRRADERRECCGGCESAMTQRILSIPASDKQFLIVYGRAVLCWSLFDAGSGVMSRPARKRRMFCPCRISSYRVRLFFVHRIHFLHCLLVCLFPHKSCPCANFRSTKDASVLIVGPNYLLLRDSAEKPEPALLV